MTVAYLWKELLKGYKQKNTFPISDINGKRIAVDFSAILHKIMAPKESKSSASVCLQLEPKYPPEDVVAKFEFYHNHFVQNKAVPLYVEFGFLAHHSHTLASHAHIDHRSPQKQSELCRSPPLFCAYKPCPI